MSRKKNNSAVTFCFHCQVCGKSYSTIKAYEKHRDSKHADASTAELPPVTSFRWKDSRDAVTQSFYERAVRD